MHVPKKRIKQCYVSNFLCLFLSDEDNEDEIIDDESEEDDEDMSMRTAREMEMDTVDDTDLGDYQVQIFTETFYRLN